MTPGKRRKIPELLVICTIIFAGLFCIFTYKDGCLPQETDLEPYRGVRRYCRVELNGADRDTLLALPGMTETAAEAILGSRDRLGGFKTGRQLGNIPGLSGEDLVDIAPYVTVSRRTS